jgi:hypothetical protein
MIERDDGQAGASVANSGTVAAVEARRRLPKPAGA